jgi:hypothetical protein
MEGWVMGKLAVRALRAVLVVVLTGTSHAAFRYVDVIIGAIVAAALVWFAVTALNAPGQRDDPGVTLIMGGIGVAILGVALIVLVLRMLLAQAVARDVEAAQMQAELDEVI